MQIHLEVGTDDGKAFTMNAEVPKDFNTLMLIPQLLPVFCKAVGLTIDDIEAAARKVREQAESET